MTKIAKARIRIFKRKVQRLGEKMSDAMPNIVLFGLVALIIGSYVGFGIVFGVAFAENKHNIPLEQRIID